MERFLSKKIYAAQSFFERQRRAVPLVKGGPPSHSAAQMLPLSKILSGQDEHFHWAKVTLPSHSAAQMLPLTKILSGKDEQFHWPKVTKFHEIVRLTLDSPSPHAT